MKNRSRTDIIATVLEAANGGITKTRILMKANLTSGQLKEYMDWLIAKNLLMELIDDSGSHAAYRTTELGIRYLAMYSSLRSIVPFPPSRSI